MTGCRASQQIQAAPAGSVAASARAHTQHHAQPEAVPAGRPAGRLAGRPAGPADGGGGGDTGDGVPDDGAGDADDDDDEEDAGFRQYYAVSRHQRAFNRKSAQEYLNKEADHKVTRMEPPKLLPTGCQPENIGLGALHMHVPHLELGLPMPPCPRCGWKSVDKNKVSSNGLCPARRVYAPEKDEWVGGLTMRCGP